LIDFSQWRTAAAQVHQLGLKQAVLLVAGYDSSSKQLILAGWVSALLQRCSMFGGGVCSM
jgi:hypothetical protein